MQLTVGRMVFDALRWGPADGTPVLLLHGFPEGNRAWAQVGELLGTAGLCAVAPDQRGYSVGARPVGTDEYTIDRLVGDAAGFLTALGWRSAHVVAHDWGAAVGWALAARHPELVRTLTAVSVPHPSAYGAALRDDADQQRRSAYIGLFRTEGKAEAVLGAQDGARLREIFDGSGLGDAEVAAIVDPLLEPGALTAVLSWYRAMRGADYAAITAVQVPTTYVWGVEDVAVGRVAAEGCAGYVTGPFRFVAMDGVGHWVPEQCPDVLASLVLEQLAL
jgi:pimeloyl-ACP methyl ester carboxylesterase